MPASRAWRGDRRSNPLLPTAIGADGEEEESNENHAPEEGGHDRRTVADERGLDWLGGFVGTVVQVAGLVSFPTTYRRPVASTGGSDVTNVNLGELVGEMGSTSPEPDGADLGHLVDKLAEARDNDDPIASMQGVEAAERRGLR